MNDRQALETAARLAALGIDVRSAELNRTAARHRDFHANGGNRAMRRAARRAQRRKGSR